jgi:SAM-dependent methyltransferase
MAHPTAPIDRQNFWNAKILGWEASRYASPAAAATGFERFAAGLSGSLRFRLAAARTLLAPNVAGRHVVELGCGSGLLAEALVTAGAASYVGYDLSDVAIARARQRTADRADGRIRFEVTAVADLPPQGDALVFSLGLFDWLSAAEIAHVLAIGKQGSFLHAIAEKRRSLQQLAHRLYVALSYGRRTGYAPAYRRVAEIDAVLADLGRPPARVFRHAKMSFGAFLTDLSF